jgi:hypothetical protein
MPAATEQGGKKLAAIAPFGIEADHPRNADLMLQAIPNGRLRGRISASRTVLDAKTGEEMVPQDQARHLGLLPQIPGMEIHVNPAKCEYVIVDPLASKPDLCEQIRKRMAQAGGTRSVSQIRGVPDQRGTLDEHRMKTLCRELVWLVEAGEAKLVKGVLPSLEDIEDLPGKFLMNPGSKIQNTQPRFEEDWEDWLSQLTKAGG